MVNVTCHAIESWLFSGRQRKESKAYSALGVVTFSVSVFTEERLLSGHSPIKPRLVEGCSDGSPSGSFIHLNTGALGRLLYQDWLVWLVGQLYELSWLFQTIPLKNDGSHCALGSLQCSRNAYIAFPRYVPQHSPVWALQAVLQTSWLGFSSDMHCQGWDLI